MQAPVLLTHQHTVLGFDCGKASLNDWLIKHALQAQSSGSARTYVLLGEANGVIGYYSLAAGHIESTQAPERVRKGMGQHPVPVMLLARLALAKTAQRSGLGPALLQDAIRRPLSIAEQAAVRALLTHPLDEQAEHFYLKFGFEPSPVSAGQLLLLLKDAKRLLG